MTKGEGFKKNDHIHSLPSWISNKGKPKRIIAPLPVPPKRPPSKPVRKQGEPEVIPSNISVQMNTGTGQISARQVGNMKVVKQKKPEKVVLIRKNGKLYVPRHMKEQFLRERAISQGTMKSLKSIKSTDTTMASLTNIPQVWFF